MKFPEGTEMQCWYCDKRITTDGTENNIICPGCGSTLKIFPKTESKHNKKNSKKAQRH